MAEIGGVTWWNRGRCQGNSEQRLPTVPVGQDPHTGRHQEGPHSCDLQRQMVKYHQQLQGPF